MTAARRRLEAAGVTDVRPSVDWAMEEVLGTSRAMLYAYPERAWWHKRTPTASWQ